MLYVNSENAMLNSFLKVSRTTSRAEYGPAQPRRGRDDRRRWRGHGGQHVELGGQEQPRWQRPQADQLEDHQPGQTNHPCPLNSASSKKQLKRLA